MVLPDVPVDGTIWTKKFWVEAIEHSIRTGATAAVLVLVGDAYETIALNALYIDWVQLVGFFLGGCLLSILMSVSANVKGRHQSANFTAEPQPQPRRAREEESP